MTIFLTKEEVISAHYFIMRKMDDADQAGVKDHGLLESAVHRPEQSIFGEDAYPDLFAKAAALLESMVKNHCFHNGNKRTAYLVTKSFLLMNGKHLKMEREYAVEFIVGIAEGLHSLDVVTSTLKHFSVDR